MSGRHKRSPNKIRVAVITLVLITVALFVIFVPVWIFFTDR
jgi:hypothetical protein